MQSKPFSFIVGSVFAVLTVLSFLSMVQEWHLYYHYHPLPLLVNMGLFLAFGFLGSFTLKRLMPK